MKVRIKKQPSNIKSGEQVNYELFKGGPGTQSDNKVIIDNKFKKTLTPVDKSVANIIAEEGENVVGDFAKNGTFQNFNIGGKKHEKGGTPLEVPDDSFIYSDNENLSLSGEILTEFGKKNTSKKFTPAEISKNYDLNHFQTILDDKNNDKLEKKTAEMMLLNYTEKLGKLALIQEGMKGFPNGVPSIAEALFPEEESGESTSMNPEEGELFDKGGPGPKKTGVNKFVTNKLVTNKAVNNNHIVEPFKHNLTRDTDLFESFREFMKGTALAKVADSGFAPFYNKVPKEVKKYTGDPKDRFVNNRFVNDNHINNNHVNDSHITNNYVTDKYVVTPNKNVGSGSNRTSAPQAVSSQYGSYDPVNGYVTAPWDYNQGFPVKNEITMPEVVVNGTPKYKDMPGITVTGERKPGSMILYEPNDLTKPVVKSSTAQTSDPASVNNNGTPKISIPGFAETGSPFENTGAKALSPEEQRRANVIAATGFKDPNYGKFLGVPGADPKKLEFDNTRDQSMPWFQQDMINNADAFIKRMNLKKYAPTMMSVDSVNPDPTFFDGTRQLTAIQEQAAQQNALAAAYGDPQRSRAVGSNIQGQAFSQAANVLSEVQNKNVGVANQFAGINAEIDNNDLLKNTMFKKQFLDEYATLNQQFDNAKVIGNEGIRTHLTNGITNAQSANYLNQMNDQYELDPTTGQITFTKGRTDNNGGSATDDDFGKSLKVEFDKIKSSNPGFADKEAYDLASKIIMGRKNLMTANNKGDARAVRSAVGNPDWMTQFMNMNAGMFN